ncbi:3-keto-5-aminohexanoate cleavage protein [Microbacterium paludicola]|uniref:3-keto-5-aminohexanoate cleavage protein n=1 Tax=Microbacterium paludicola TaxID=300019 RepID=UPI0011A546C7|nr:3-keto-5-aminohexanoate cleavage protein [Microbacterium paludicola]
MLIQACVNGAREVAEHPRLSADEHQVAAEAAGAIAAGAEAIHVHPKDAAGLDSLAAEDVARWVRAVRVACPGVPVGVTTGAWAASGVEDRLDAVAGWVELPDFASVNWHEDGADVVASALVNRGVSVEAGIWNDEGATAWSRSPVRDECVRVLVEVPDMAEAEARVLAEDLLARVEAMAPGVQILLHGEGQSTWAVLDLAVARGLATRIGLEDCLTLPDGSPARDNAALVRAAMERLPPSRLG